MERSPAWRDYNLNSDVTQKEEKINKNKKKNRNVTKTFIKYYAISCQTYLRFWLLSALVPLMEDFGRKVLEVIWKMKKQGL